MKGIAEYPTAQTPMPGTLATEVKEFMALGSNPAGFGVVKTCQVVPSQCWARVSNAELSL
ncbi:MAG: hypothetical protein DMF24_05725 [Verrucomicrobia bacterium]|nr:MAG: hypothetical protein DMF24_05725 [Verrucomicrobiota bacterium]